MKRTTENGDVDDFVVDWKGFWDFLMFTTFYPIYQSSSNQLILNKWKDLVGFKITFFLLDSIQDNLRL